MIDEDKSDWGISIEHFCCSTACTSTQYVARDLTASTAGCAGKSFYVTAIWSCRSFESQYQITKKIFML